MKSDVPFPALSTTSGSECELSWPASLRPSCQCPSSCHVTLYQGQAQERPRPDTEEGLCESSRRSTGNPILRAWKLQRVRDILPLSQPAADTEYARRSFQKLSSLPTYTTSSLSNYQLLPPFFSLDRCIRRKSSDASALHLFALICQSLHLGDLAILTCTHAIAELEKVYEETKDEKTER